MSDLLESMAEFQRCAEARDRAGAERVLDQGFELVLVSPALAQIPRARWLDVLKDYVIHDYEVEHQIVHADGDCAAVASRIRMSATVLGEDRSGTFVISDVWRRREAEWLLWRRHSTPLSAGRMPGADE